MSEESNGNRRRGGGSNEDLSEYTDADESISAPTEFLAEFLSALMLKDYTTAFKYCKLILQYEPNNSTAKEFYPLILDKIQQISLKSSSSESSSEDESGEVDNDDEDEEPSESLGQDVDSAGDQVTASDKDDELVLSLETSVSENMRLDVNVEHEVSADILKSSDGTTNSYSSLEDEEAARDDVMLEEVIVEDNYAEGDDNGNTVTIADHKMTVPSPDEDYNFNWFTKIKPKPEVNRNNLGITSSTPFLQTSSDSDSPTDPVTQHTIEMLRAKFVHATN